MPEVPTKVIQDSKSINWQAIFFEISVEVAVPGDAQGDHPASDCHPGKTLNLAILDLDEGRIHWIMVSQTSKLRDTSLQCQWKSFGGKKLRQKSFVLVCHPWLHKPARFCCAGTYSRTTMRGLSFSECAKGRKLGLIWRGTFLRPIEKRAETSPIENR